MQKIGMFSLYVCSIVLAVGIGVWQAGVGVTEMRAALPKCKHGDMVKPACIGSSGCDGATYKTYLEGTDVIATTTQWPPGTPDSKKDQCYVAGGPILPGGSTWDDCDATQPYYDTTGACSPE